MSGVVLGSNNITINGRIMETRKYTFIEPTSSPSVPKITINSDYKYMSFINDNTEPSLIAFYKFDGNYNDSSGNNHHLTNNGASLQSTHVISGQAVDFDNTDFLTFPSSINPFTIWNGNGITFAFWTKISSSSGIWSRLIDFQPNTFSTAGFLIAQQSTGNPIEIWMNGSMGAVINLTNFANNEWRHISFSVSTTGVWTVYVNGVNQNVSATRNIPNLTYNLQYINKSVFSGDGNWDGQIDNFRIYNRVLSQADVSSLYNTKNTLPPKTYTINFAEQTEVQVLLLDNLKYIETVPFLTTGSYNVVVGVPSTFNTITTTTNSTLYNSGYVSNITGSNITYNNPIVIIRYSVVNDAQWTYSASNPNVFHLGNVGIGTTNPTSDLHVLGSVLVNGAINATSLTANTKSFKIEHPLNINKWLYHGCVESPRFDNIYRGKKLIINGRGEVDIDEECNTTGGMTKGTFESLNTNFSLCLQNKQSFDGVKGSIKEGNIIINCENTEDEIEVDWLVIGERKDENIKSNKLTNNEGKLICEHEME